MTDSKALREAVEKAAILLHELGTPGRARQPSR